MDRPSPHLAILGAGPTGLEAALAAAEHGWSFTLYERGSCVAAGIRSWGHVQVFTPWDMNVSPRARRVLGERAPAGERCPTGNELVDELLEPLSRLPQITPHLRLDTTVSAIGRRGLLKHEEIGSPERAGRPFRLLLRGADGKEWTESADWVVDCTGSGAVPNAVGDGGIPAPGERACSSLIEHRIPDFAAERDAWRGRRILLIGAGHSAQTAARDLADLADEHPGTEVVWSLRAAEPFASIDPEDPLPERLALHRRARQIVRGEHPAFTIHPATVIDHFEPVDGDRVRARLRPAGGGPAAGECSVEVDRVLALTGSVGDHGLYRQLQVHECYATSGPMKLAAALLGAGAGDCLAQQSHGADSLMNPEPGFFILGSKSYGRNTTFLMRTGWEQVEELFGHLEGQIGAA